MAQTATALTVEPIEVQPDTGIDHATMIAGGLSDLVSDTYLLMIKTHGVHWNVMGPLFHSVHELTEGQYEEMFEAIDVMAERVRALGALAPSNAEEMQQRSALTESKQTRNAGDMLAELVADHECMARRLKKLADSAAQGEDIVTEDLCVARSAFHEKAAWMLRSLAKT
jgi:starvation-inducible DNA-binding protein